MGKLAKKVALITGGNSGIGLATAELFVKEGAYVFITGRRQTELDAAVKKIGKNCMAIQADVAELEDLDRMYELIKKEKGFLDIVFANAGFAEFSRLGSITEEHYDKIFNINVKGVLFTIQKTVPLLRDGGAIVLNASIVASTGPENLSVYSASKAAVRSFARTWSVDLKPRHIRVNALSPGVVPTPGYSTALKMKDQEIQAYAEQSALVTPLGRVGLPEEVAKAVLFLASDDSSFVTGIELFVDGGIAQI